MQTNSMVGKVLLVASLGVSVGLSAVACNGESSDDDNSGGEASGGDASGGKGSGGKGTGGKASGGTGAGGKSTGGASSGGASSGGDAGSNAGGDAGADGMGGAGAELEALCEERCRVTVQLECPGWDDLAGCTAGCVAADEFVPDCSEEYRANVQCEATDVVEGFDCFPISEDYYYLVQSAESACTETYEAYAACGT